MPIINDVEVEGCEYRHTGELLPKSTCNLSYHERQDGRMAYKDCQDIPNCLYKQLQQLKKENEQLKALKDTYLTCYKAKHNDIEGKIFKYKNALEEIREITQTVYKSCDNFCADSNRIYLIIDKIDEVLR